jgi:hypothetical protein
LIIIQISLSFDSPSKTINFYAICNGFNLTIFDGLTNINGIAWNLNDHVLEHIYKKKFKFLFIFI